MTTKAEREAQRREAARDAARRWLADLPNVVRQWIEVLGDDIGPEQEEGMRGALALLREACRTAHPAPDAPTSAEIAAMAERKMAEAAS
jgi:hypothetical protein